MAYNGKRLHKSDSDKKLCGVCGGIAEYFNIDPTIVRLGWIIFCLAGGSGVLRAFYCDSVRVNGRDLGRRLVAVSPDIYGDSGFQGVWRMEEQEGAHELVQAALE